MLTLAAGKPAAEIGDATLEKMLRPAPCSCAGSGEHIRQAMPVDRFCMTVADPSLHDRGWHCVCEFLNRVLHSELVSTLVIDLTRAQLHWGAIQPPRTTRSKERRIMSQASVSNVSHSGSPLPGMWPIVHNGSM